MSTETEALERLLLQVRRCFNRLKGLAERLHADLEVSAAQRAVLEALARGGALSVPAIATARGVSRQHVQVIMNVLSDRSLVIPRANPTHKRSPLFALSDEGERLFALMRQREAAILASLAAVLDPAAVRDAERVLAQLDDALIELDQGDEDDDRG